MGKSVVITVLVTLIFVAFACAGYTLFRETQSKRSARRGLAQLKTTALPQEPDGWELIGILPETFKAANSTECYIARDYTLYGISRDAEVERDRYISELKDIGWEDWRWDSAKYASHGTISVSFWNAYDVLFSEIANSVDVEQYEAVLIVRVDYVYPERYTCGQ